MECRAPAAARGRTLMCLALFVHIPCNELASALLRDPDRSPSPASCLCVLLALRLIARSSPSSCAAAVCDIHHLMAACCYSGCFDSFVAPILRSALPTTSTARSLLLSQRRRLLLPLRVSTASQPLFWHYVRVQTSNNRLKLGASQPPKKSPN